MKCKYNYVYININFDCRFNTTSAYIWWENGKLYLMNFTWTRKFWIHLYHILICSNEYKFVDCRPKTSCKHCHQKPNTVYQWWKIVSYLTLMKCIETRTFWFHLYQIITCSCEYKFVDCRPKASCKHCQQKPSWCKLFKIIAVTVCCFKSLLV